MTTPNIDYAKYSETELIQAAHNIHRGKYPEQWSRLLAELTGRGLYDPLDPLAPKPAPPPPPAVTELDEKICEILSKPVPELKTSGFNLGIFLFSLFAFGFFQSFTDHPERWIALAIALVIHELGHVIAMRAFGYKNVGVLLIPGLGAITRGTPMEQGRATWNAIISLSGPVLGLLSTLPAILLYRSTGFEGFREYVKIAGVLNALNLLPIRPLDGGGFVSELFFSRWPVLELVFGLGSVAVLALPSIKAHRPLWVPLLIGYWVLGQSVMSFRMARIAKKLRGPSNASADLKADAATRAPVDRDSRLDPQKVSMIRHQLDSAHPELASQIRSSKRPTQVYAIWVKRIWNQSRKQHASISEIVGLLILGALFTMGPGRLAHYLAAR